MDFIDFARAHGLIVNNVYANRWIAVPTDDHPKKRNGRYKWLGEVGWVQNWATMESPAMWKGQGISPLSIRKVIQQSNQDREKDAQAAARKAGWILHQSVMAEHPYLEKKGFPKECGNVWDDGSTRLLVIPMRIGQRLVGVQLIDQQGKKKFLRGQVTKGAAFVMDAKGLPIFVEGYATGLSVREAMKALRIRYTIYVCFSAGNLQEIARSVEGGIVVADHDESGTGQNTAIATGKPYWLSEARGDDFNDYHQREGTFHAAQSLKSLILSTDARHAVGI
jgi:putative DNA primase/helicase